MSNDHGAKGLAYNRFFRDTCNHLRRYKTWKQNEKI